MEATMGNNSWGGYASWDQGQTWGYDPNYHFTSDGKAYYVAPGEDPNDKDAWKADTMAGWHQANQPVSIGELNIAEDAYPWSRTGLPQWGLDTVRGLAEGLPGLLGSFQNSINSLETQTPLLLDQSLANAGKSFMQGLDPFANYLRQPFEKANARGMGDGTLARDTAVNLGGLLADDYRKAMTDQGQKVLELKAAIPQAVANLRGQAYQTTANVLNAAQVSESQNKLAQYEAMLNALLG